jgi:phosphoribosylformylglycinamidine synthase
MPVFRIEVTPLHEPGVSADSPLTLHALREAGLGGLRNVIATRLFFIEGAISRGDADAISEKLLRDPVAESADVLGAGDGVPGIGSGRVAVEVHLRPGVMDPVAESTLMELRHEGYAAEAVRTARRYVLSGQLRDEDVVATVGRVLANDCIEEVVLGSADVRPASRPPEYAFRPRQVALLHLDDPALERLSRDAHLFLSLAELHAIQGYFSGLGREPTDLELETLAQTWSEHCVHKTLKSAVVYRGAALPRGDGQAAADETRRYDNLLQDTIARATAELTAAGAGPECLSVFQDNAGVIAFDEQFGIAFKVETHNHPSAIEPYGGAATGIGGVIRDVIGCGLGAKPIASTDVFCVAPSDWPQDHLPKGVLHPRRVLRGIVDGVGDYGNRMGIPTVNGAVYFEPRYLGNPLVFCGSLGLIPRDKVQKAARAGDHIVVIGGRTGRDGIHGATFSSAELTDTHADEFSHAVQIGNAITEKRFLDAILQARDAEGGSLYTALTDCGAGGLSSAIGEMGEHSGATVDLERVPLKYPGLRYDEIWISEAQERMVVAVPPAQLPPFMEIMAAEEVDATVIGTFGTAATTPATPRLIVRYAGQVVGELNMKFLHHGWPRDERVAEWQPEPPPAASGAKAEAAAKLPHALRQLESELARPNVASKAWIIRRYDHEVQGGSVLKPLVGPGRGPSDAAVLRPRLAVNRGIAIGCGLAPQLADVDPYWMAAAAIDEALRNVICVGGDPHRTAILDNFCWGRTDDARQLGALVRACQACYDVAKAYGLPFISGKDSLNNEFALDEADLEPLVETLRAYGERRDADGEHLGQHLAAIEGRLRSRRRLAIPQTLLISALSLVDDVRRCVSPDLKQAGHAVLLVGGLRPTGFSLAHAADVHHAVAEAIRTGLVAACHDAAEGGWLVALAEMAIAGKRGVALHSNQPFGLGPYEEGCATYLVEVYDEPAAKRLLEQRCGQLWRVATVSDQDALHCDTESVALAALGAAWHGR